MLRARVRAEAHLLGSTGLFGASTFYGASKMKRTGGCRRCRYRYVEMVMIAAPRGAALEWRLLVEGQAAVPETPPRRTVIALLSGILALRRLHNPSPHHLLPS